MAGAPATAAEPTVQRDLFGGAIVAAFPARYLDVSDFRPVPDNQEVWTDANKDESVIVARRCRVCGARDGRWAMGGSKELL